MSNCCTECFNDSILKDHINSNGTQGNCNYCGAQNVNCINPEDLEDIFTPLVKLYDIVENFMPGEELREFEGQFIWEKLNYDWEIFAFYEYHKQEKLVREIFESQSDPKEGDDQFLNSWVEIEDDYYGHREDSQGDLARLWNAFCDEIKYENRYFPTKTLNSELLTNLISLLGTPIQMGNRYYRARNPGSKIKLPPSKMGKPPKELSQSGRANPKGIPYLYLSSAIKTAIAEIRPYHKARVTVGKFQVINSLNVVDLRDPHIDSPFQFGNRLEFAYRYMGFLRKLGSELSKTVDPNFADLEYIPLQYLCECIKTEDYDGVLYKSSVADGDNIAVFSDDKLKCISTALYEVTDTEYTFIKK
jgi:hypothetical protein